MDTPGASPGKGEAPLQALISYPRQFKVLEKILRLHMQNNLTQLS